MTGHDESPEEMFQRTLRMDVDIARILIAGGILTLEELAYVPINELLEVRGLSDLRRSTFGRSRASTSSRTRWGRPRA